MPIPDTDRVPNSPTIITIEKPVRKIEVGDTLEFLCDVSTRAGNVHQQGSLIEVLSFTQETPFGEIGHRGYNWVCRTQYGDSNWATLESCLSRGLLIRWPKPFETIYVPPSWHIEAKFNGDEYVDSFAGGPVTVRRMFRAQGYTWVEIEERPGHGYNWHKLEAQQRGLETAYRFGDLQ